MTTRRPVQDAVSFTHCARFLLQSFRLLCFLPLLSACATTPPASATAPASIANLDLGTEQGWWSVAITIRWPADTAPKFHVDPLLAAEVFRPLILRHESALPLWRFHRRAARDDAGHRFRFLFYASRATAAAVYEELAADAMLKRLRADGVLTAIQVDDVHTTWRPEPGAMGDPRWSPEINRAWPYFALGVSKTWLALIESVAGSVPTDLPVAEIMSRYETAERRIRSQWQAEGGHAFLHHLNALFGYEPVAVRF